MSRIVSVWLPRWPILRSLAAQEKKAKKPSGKPVDPDQPFVLAITAAGGPRIAALNEAAEAAGILLGEPLADARAKTSGLQARAVDAAADDAALRRLALWATRYTPTASPWNAENGADGFFLDIEGAAHLFGGEQKLTADLASRLRKNFGLAARLAVADTVGAAWALSRFHAVAACTILPSGQEAEALALLPIKALRLSAETCTTLRRLGFKSIGALLDKPRAPFAARFPAELLRRLDQALGRVDEPLVPVVPSPVYHALRYLLEPIITQEAVVALAKRLMQMLTHVLTRDDVGARALRLCLYRVDGAVETVDIALTLPTRNVAHVARLLDLKLEALSAMQEAGFGFEAVGLAVTCAEPMVARQTEFSSIAEDAANADRTERCTALIDTLRQRLGPHSVRRFEPVASHIPERAEVLPSVSDEPPASWPEWEQKTRPLFLLPRAEPTEVAALVPDGPPRRFSWRGVTYEVAGAQGPERIAAEWWRGPHLSAHSRGSGKPAPHEDGEEKLGLRFRGDKRPNALTRDYYLVEDTTGHRFWLFRQGLYGRETAAARWFVHGLFA
jgi:protein ImuB